MPDLRKHILVEPDTHHEFEKFKVEERKTQDSGITYLLRFRKLTKKLDPALAKKINFTLQ